MAKCGMKIGVKCSYDFLLLDCVSCIVFKMIVHKSDILKLEVEIVN